MNYKSWQRDLVDIAAGVAARAAIKTLEDRGLVFCVHFGYQNAVEILAEMDAAFVAGNLYEWLAGRVGIVTERAA